MVRLVIYPCDEYNDEYDSRRTEECLVSDWRPSELMLVPDARSNSLIKIENTKIDEEFDNRNRYENLKDCFSANSLKSINRTISEYWNDVWCYHWSIAVQSIFLVIIIVALGPWFGFKCNPNISKMDEYPTITWQLPILSKFITILYPDEHSTTKPTCDYGFCCFSQNIEGSSTRRRASFLKRQRITRALDEF